MNDMSDKTISVEITVDSVCRMLEILRRIRWSEQHPDSNLPKGRTGRVAAAEIEEAALGNAFRVEQFMEHLTANADALALNLGWPDGESLRRFVYTGDASTTGMLS